VYDHCAAFTRLYAIYATYVEDLVDTYLGILPTLYDTYGLLPRAVTTQHRVGLGLILGKLGDGGAYSYLDEASIVNTFSQGLTGGTPYKLIKHAFLTDRQNYRLDVLGKLLGYLGVQDATQHLSSNRDLLSFLEVIKPGTSTVQSELDQFVKRRNEAAHSDVNDIVAIDDIKQTADFIGHLGNALASILTYELINRRHILGHFPKLGVVEKTYKGGTVIISHVWPCMLRIGEQIAVVRGDRLHLATITGLQIDDIDYNPVLLATQTELGIQVDRKVIEGAAIHALREQQTAPYQILQLFEQRRDDFVAEFSNALRDLQFVTGHRADLEIESIEAIELDKPSITTIEADKATLKVVAHVSFAATATYDAASPDTDDSEEKSSYPERVTTTVTRAIHIPVEYRVEYPGILDLSDPSNATVMVESVNAGRDLFFDLDRPEDSK
jgi:hypothetical protein